MAWGGGTYTKPYTWTAGTPILATDHNAQDTDFTNGINNCLAKDGQNAMTGNLSLGGNILTNVGAGSAAAPSFSPGADVDTGMFLAGTNALGLSTGGVERIRVSSAGNVGIGTTNPTSNLDLGNGTSPVGLSIRLNAGSGNNSGGGIYFANSSTNNSAVGAWSALIGGAQNNALTLWAGSGNEIRFVTNGAGNERMRITSGGQVLCGPIINANTNEGVFITPTNGAGISYIGVSHTSADVGGNWYATFSRNDVQVGTITSSGTTGVAYNVTSDYRLKENVQPIQGGLARVKNLRPVAYSWKQDGTLGEGFLAHELQEIIPQAVTGAKDEIDANGAAKYQGVDYGKLTTVLTAAMKELTAKVEALEAQVASLAVP